MMYHYACGGSFIWIGSRWLPQGGWPHNWAAATIFLLSPGCFLIVLLQWCSVWISLLGRLHTHSTKYFLLLSGHFWLHLDLVMGSRLLGVPVGALWIRNFVLSTSAVSAVVWLGWGVENFKCVFHVAWNLFVQLSYFVIPFKCYLQYSPPCPFLGYLIFCL